MATSGTSGQRDVRLGLEIQTAGEDDVRRLAAAVRSLGKEGDPAAAEFGRLATALDRLADQSAAVTSLQTLSGNVDKLAVSQRDAATAADSASARFREQAAAVASLREAQATAADAARQAKIALTDMNAELARSIIDAKAAGKSQKDIAAATQEARLAIVDQGVALKTRNLALKDANTELAQAEQAERKLRTEFQATATAATATSTAFAAQSTALKEARTAAEALGVDVSDLAAAQAKLLASTRDYANEAANSQRATIASAEAARVAAAAALQLAAANERTAAAQRDYNAAVAASDSDRANLQAAIDYTRQLAVEVDRLNAEEEALAASTREAEAALRRLESAATSDRIRELAANLREADAAARRFATATAEVARAGESDIDTMQRRVRAAEQLIASERELTAEEAKLAAQANAGRAALLKQAEALVAQQRALDASSAATRRLVQESIALGSAAEATGKALGRAGTLAEDAFGKVGVRSMQAIEKEIRQVDLAVSLLERNFRAGKISADDLARAVGAATVKLNQLQNEARQVQSLPGVFDRVSTSINGLLTKFGALGAAVATVGVAVRPVLEATVALEQMRRTLTTVTGSAETAGQQIDFLRRVSQTSGQQFDELGASYAKFAASALQSGLSIKQTQSVFQSVALAAGNLGLSSDQAKRALEALSQIASKGVVSMEELRQQLGDALPGVLPLLAKELGLTQAELNKLVESGNLLAGEAIPAIGRSLVALQSQSGRVDGLTASWNRFVNVIKEAGTTLVDGPLGGTVGVLLTALAGVIRDVSVVTVSASEAFRAFGLSTLAVFDALAGNTTFDELKKSLSDFAADAGDRIQKFKDTAYGADAATKQLAGGVTTLSGSLARLSIDQQKAIDAADLAAQSAEKHVKAIKDEGEAYAIMIGLLGDETAARQADIEVSARVLVAKQQLAAADQAVVTALTNAKIATEAKARADGLSADAIKTVIAAYDIKILKATADAEKSAAAEAASRALAVSFQLAGAAALDNSKRIDELRAAVTAAGIAQTEVARRFAEGKASAEQLTVASEALAKAKGLLRDAINDLSEALERELALMRASAKLAEARVKLDIEKAKTAQTAALAEGNETKAREQGNKIRELELVLMKSSATLKAAEAKATLKAIDAQERELKLLGQLTDEKAAEFEIRRKTAQASVVEAETLEETNKARQIEIDQLRQGGTVRRDYTERVKETRDALDRDTTSLGTNTAALRVNQKAIEDMGTAVERLNAINALRSGVSPTAGNASGNYNDTVKSNLPTNQYDPKTGMAVDSSGNPIVFTDQANIPEGYFFDKAAYDKAVGDAWRAGSQNIIDPNRFVKLIPPEIPSYFSPPSVPKAPVNGTTSGRGGSSSTPSSTVPPAPKPGAAPAAPAPFVPTYTSEVVPGGGFIPTPVVINIGNGQQYLVGVSGSSTGQLLDALEASFRAGGGALP